MKHFTDWASREYAFAPRLLVTLSAGLLFALLIPYMLIRIIPGLDTILHLPQISLGVANYLVGGTLVIIGVAYAQWSIITQLSKGRGTPIPFMATQTLLVNAPFGHCRNPMALGAILAYFGIGFVVGSISSILFCILFTAFLVAYIKLIEEKELETRFGQDYLEYKKATPFIIPRIIPPKR